MTLILAGATARADGDADRAVARSLAEEGSRLLSRGQVAEACQKLQESRRLAPAAETGMKLAECYERAGRTASAWSLYLDVATAERDTGHRDREKAARARAAALEGKIARITITVTDPASTPGIVVQRDGVPVPPVQWGVAIPLDPGQHTIAVQAPGRYAWQNNVTVNAGDAAMVAVPALPPLPAAYEPPPPRARRERLRLPKGERYSTGLMAGGIVLSALSPIAGILTGLLAAEAGARDNEALAVGLTTFFVLAGAGIPMAVIGGRRGPPGQREPEEEARARVLVGPLGIAVAGSF